MALMYDEGKHYTDIAHEDSDIRRISNYADFVRWIHEDWQEMCIDDLNKIGEEKMAKQMIEIEVPDGYEIERVSQLTDWPAVTRPAKDYRVILKKKKPKHRVFEESLTKRQVKTGDMYLDEQGEIVFWTNFHPSPDEYTILTEIKDDND
jgi:hypothetical protein